MERGNRIRAVSLPELSEEAILKYLFESDEPEWGILMRHRGFSVKWLLVFLKRPRPIPKQAILDIYHNAQLRKNYQVCLNLLRCKSTPAPLAMNLIHTVRWVDLFHTLRLTYLSGPVRQKIETRLMEILPRLALGEKITLARQAPRPLIKHLRLLTDRPVIKALFFNFHFTYEDAMFLANFPQIEPPILEELALSTRWRAYKNVRRALLLNPKTPRTMTYPLACTLTDHDLRLLLKDPRLTTFPRRIVQKVLDEKLYTRKGGHSSS